MQCPQPGENQGEVVPVKHIFMIFVRVTSVILVLAPLAIPGYPFKLPSERTSHLVDYDSRWRHVRPHETNVRTVGTMTRRMGRGEGEDDKRSMDDQIDYSADPLTAFLGKFLPKDRTAAAPQAKDLVRSSVRVRSTCCLPTVPSSCHTVRREKLPCARSTGELIDI